MTLREQFNEEQKLKTQDSLELLFLLSDQYYIPWLEDRLNNKNVSKSILTPRITEY